MWHITVQYFIGIVQDMYISEDDKCGKISLQNSLFLGNEIAQYIIGTHQSLDLDQ